jgi:serine/threonine protein kinase
MGQAGVICTNCGTVNDPHDQFCSNCGFELAGSSVGAISGTSTSAPSPVNSSGRRTTGALAIGSLLGGRYRIVQLVGKGGFGAVYKALDERFQGQRVVAIKELSDAQVSPSEKAKALQDFRRYEALECDGDQR